MADQVVAISYQPRALVQLKILLPSVPAGLIYPADGVLRLTVGIARRFQVGRSRRSRRAS